MLQSKTAGDAEAFFQVHKTKRKERRSAPFDLSLLDYLHSDGEKRASRVPFAVPAKPLASDKLPMQRHAIASADGVNAAVPTGITVPIGEFGVRINVPLPAAGVVVMVIKPVPAAITTLVVLTVAVGGV